jgi:hypothetical protein
MKEVTRHLFGMAASKIVDDFLGLLLFRLTPLHHFSAERPSHRSLTRGR